MWEPNTSIYLPGALGDNVMQIPFALSCAGIVTEDDIRPAIDFYLGRRCTKRCGDEAVEWEAELFRIQPYTKTATVSVEYDAPTWALDSGAIDTDAQRNNACIDMTRGDICWRNCFQHRCLEYWDPCRQWIFLPPDERYASWRDKIVVSATPRYPNHHVTWRSLEPYLDRCVFIGLEENRKGFYFRHHLNLSFHEVKDFTEMAQIISHSAFFVGTQSFPACLAEALKANRIIVQCPELPDLLPRGGAGNAVVNENDLSATLRLYADAFLL